MFKWWKKFLLKLEEANKESFPSGQKLDCCSINRTIENENRR